MQIIKIGGSVITVKSRYRYFQEKLCARIIREIRGIKESVIIIHGGGSFGHIKAKEYGLGGKPAKEKTRGISTVHRDMVDLDQRIVNIMIEEGLSPLSLPPSTFSENGEIPFDLFSLYLSTGMIPVTFGDVYIHNGNAEIISGDDLMLSLAVHFKPSRAIFISDVDGIYEANPKTHPFAKLRREIMGNEKFETTSPDVTGGMAGKVKKMQKIAEAGVPVYLINGKHPERIGSIDTPDFVGTVIH